MTDTLEAIGEEMDGKRRQKAALAVLSTPVVARMGLRPGRVTQRRIEDAKDMATLEGYGSDVFGWANDTFKTRGVR